MANTTIFLLVSDYCTGTTMIVIDDRHKFEDMTEESIQSCKAEGIFFAQFFQIVNCMTLLSRRKRK